MDTISAQAGELIKALKQGKLLERLIGCDTSIRYLFMEINEYPEVKGFGSANVKGEQILLDVIYNSDRWRVSKREVKDCPWNYTHLKW